jgi:hypothetical protein
VCVKAFRASAKRVASDVAPVLGRRAYQRRPADVDVLDRFVERAIGARDRLPERIEIDDDEVDRRNAVRGECRCVRGQIATREDAAVHLRMQRLDAAVEHLREARVVADLGDVEIGGDERSRGSAGREQHDAGPAKNAREFDEPGLVRDRKERAGDGSVHAAVSASVEGTVGTRRPPRRGSAT